MTPLKQRNRHRPTEGIWGDCHRAAIASVLDLPLDAVPHFGDGGPDGVEFQRREDEFLRSVGLVAVRIIYPGDDRELVFRALKGMNPGIYYLFGGRSATGVDHTVVGIDDGIVHDPSLNDSGIVGPCDDGWYWVTFFGCACATRKVTA
jgi:hypothetical protein